MGYFAGFTFPALWQAAQPAWVNGIAMTTDDATPKSYGHGASSAGDVEELLGRRFDRGLSHLKRRYNDGVNQMMHYVTAREAYNPSRADVDDNIVPDHLEAAFVMR